jgi:hypothetical protein
MNDAFPRFVVCGDVAFGGREGRDRVDEVEGCEGGFLGHYYDNCLFDLNRLGFDFGDEFESMGRIRWVRGVQCTAEMENGA